ncbi:hypothetical protein DFJ43DRAFT_1060921 [Lentinula guzmanii]|uniref:Zn(2)-C6 fungal-type domain-containing protein n=1 Tax=Lentinula guzmanii TaxID=2804957 RepID=A0AA38MVN1_9AGAR|nr:hypothetical protein DFJ43DRAFT_1060921 [Lentinula guzmanii]
MNSAQGSSVLQQQEDEKPRDVKPVVKTLNRVPRACNACRKQKMRCEGADNPPCKRCRNAGLECLFEKPTREATLTGEAGLERIRSLESHVVEIRNTQNSILNTLADIQASLRGGTFQNRSPSAYPPSFHHQSPSVNSPSLSTPPTSHPHVSDMQPSTASGSHPYVAHPLNQPSSSRPSRPPIATYPSQNSQTSPVDYHQSGSQYPHQYPPNGNFQQQQPQQQQPPTPQQGGPVLPPFSSLQTLHPQSSVRFQGPSEEQIRVGRQPSSNKRQAPGSSNVTSANSSDIDDDESGELPASGLVAPWEVLRGLADVATERAAKENGDSSEPHSRARTPTPERQTRPTKRRKIRHKLPRGLTFPDIVTKKIISEAEARELFRIFYHGSNTFLPVFDFNVDTYDALHERSPFAVNCICMVAARVRDGGGKASETYKHCLEEVHAISRATLFAPVTRVEAVQAMILVSGWSDNGWLSGGHAVRMAMELSLHKAWPRLLRRINTKKTSEEDRDLVIASRTWFCLYLFEHQLSYGTGRPAILKDDESVQHCRLLLQHPLAIEDDMRLVSTVELIMLRERVQNALSSFDEPVKDSDFDELKKADGSFRVWFATWDHAFSQKYEDAAFYRQSLQIQQFHAELFHNATALRGINGPEDVHRMPHMQRDLAIRSIQIARQGLDITVNSPAYREGMKYAVHYTHATATFAASFLLRLARLFPNECDTFEIKNQVERLANLMAEIPGKRYALTLQVMLKRFKKRKSVSTSRSPTASRESHRISNVIEHSGSSSSSLQSGQVSYSPVYDTHFGGHPDNALAGNHPQMQQQQQQQQQLQPHLQPADAENIWRGFEMTANEQLPVWISDQTLGGNSFSQNGMDAFLLPTDYLPPAPQIW